MVRLSSWQCNERLIPGLKTLSTQILPGCLSIIFGNVQDCVHNKSNRYIIVQWVVIKVYYEVLYIGAA
jgi:hypothetical protein